MKITRAPRRGKPTSFLCRIRQAVPHAESDVAWSGSYSADPLIRGGIPCGVFVLTILLDLFAALAVKLGMPKIGVIGIYILGAVITFGLSMVSGFGMMI